MRFFRSSALTESLVQASFPSTEKSSCTVREVSYSVPQNFCRSIILWIRDFLRELIFAIVKDSLLSLGMCSISAIFRKRLSSTQFYKEPCQYTNNNLIVVVVLTQLQAIKLLETQVKKADRTG